VAPPPRPANHRASRLAGTWVRMNPRRKTQRKRRRKEERVERVEWEERERKLQK